MTDPAATPYTTAQDGLAVASALLPATEERVTAVHVGRQHLTVSAPPHRDGGSAGPSPLGLFAAALASDTAITLRAHLDSTYSYGGDLEVVVAVRPGWVLDVRVTYTEDLDAEQLDGAREVAGQAPLTRVLGTGVELRTTFAHSSALTR
ncbi:OsmC family protein [Geodermatophilus sp. SYSU D00814]